MGSYDGAEVCELVGLYLLKLLTNEFRKHKIGLYKDYCLSGFKNISGPGSEKIKNKMRKILKKKRFKHCSRMKFSYNRFFGYYF